MEAEGRRRAPASDYDTFVNWEVRLNREAPFFEAVFAEAGVRSVIDVGAGSGRHAVLFGTWGLAVEAVDPAETMLASAEENISAAARVIADAGGSVRLARGGFGELEAMQLGPVDAVICTGNALPHVEGLDGLRVALADFAAVVRPGGVLVLHLLNHARLLEKKPRAIMPVVREVPEGTRVFLRVIDYPPSGEFLGFDFVTLVRDMAGEWTVASRASAHTALPVGMLLHELEAAGFDDIETFGGHDRAAFDAEKDESLLLVARREG